MNIQPIFKFGETVYYHNSEDLVGKVTGLRVKPDSSLLYYVTWANDLNETAHYGFELSRERTYNTGAPEE